MTKTGPPQLRAPSTRCAEIDFNLYEQRRRDLQSPPDLLTTQRLYRDPIMPAETAGLRPPQVGRLSVEMYNGGCENAWGCVPVDESCAGPLRRDTRFEGILGELLAPMAHVGAPPPYAEGIKHGLPGSVSGYTPPCGP
jgi:hypothetical protein